MLNTIFKVIFSILCFVVLLCATLLLHHFLIEVIDSHIKETLPLRIKLFYGFLVMALFAVILFAFGRMLRYIQTSVLSTILRGIFIVQFVWLSISLGLFLYTSTTKNFYLQGTCADMGRNYTKVKLGSNHNFLLIDNADYVLYNLTYFGHYTQQDYFIYFTCIYPYPKKFTGVLSSYPKVETYLCGCQNQENTGPYQYKLSIPRFSHGCLGMKENNNHP